MSDDVHGLVHARVVLHVYKMMTNMVWIHDGVSNFSTIYQASLNMRINVSLDCGQVHNVAPVTTGTCCIDL